MKKILFRKILFDCLKFFIVTIIGTSVIVWVFQAVNYLDIMVEDGRNYQVYFKYTMLSLPKIISKIFPFAIFISFFYIISKYENKNELIIFWTHGITKLQVINFFLKASLALLIFHIIFISFLVPFTQDKARSIIRDSNINFFDSLLTPKTFNDVIKGVTIYTDEKDEDGSLKNIFIKKTNNDSEFEITFSQTGEIKNLNNNQVLVLYDGQNIKGNKNNLDSFSFSKSDFNLSVLETNITTYKKTQENSTFELINCYFALEDRKKKKVNKFNVENCRSDNLSNIFGELYKRFIIPLYIPILILVSLILILISKEKSNYIKLKLIIFLFGLFVIIFSETTLRFVENNLSDNIKLILIPFFSIIVFYSVISLKLKWNVYK
ncbi:LptF/LptG family permease [Pelagibacterales bacterium SAG-MED35]|nr:LptF/LptG family permease [Pelagibacterales bacterium SAG-MED35]